FVVDGTKRQWNASVNPAHHAAEVGFNTRAIHQHRTDYHHLHTCLLSNLTQPLLCLHLGNTIRILGRWGIKRSVRLTRRCTFAIDLDRADEDESFNAGSRSLPCKIQRAVHIYLAKL